MEDAQRDDAPYRQQQRWEPAHRGKRDEKARIEQIQLWLRRLIDRKNGVDKHHQEQRGQQERIEGGLHRKQVHHQEEDHSAQDIHLVDDLVGGQDRVEKQGLESHE